MLENGLSLIWHCKKNTVHTESGGEDTINATCIYMQSVLACRNGNRKAQSLSARHRDLITFEQPDLVHFTAVDHVTVRNKIIIMEYFYTGCIQH